MKAKATVRLRLSLEKQLTTIFAALTPEAQKPVGTRAVASLVREGSIRARRQLSGFESGGERHGCTARRLERLPEVDRLHT